MSASGAICHQETLLCNCCEVRALLCEAGCHEVAVARRASVFTAGSFWWRVKGPGSGAEALRVTEADRDGIWRLRPFCAGVLVTDSRIRRAAVGCVAGDKAALWCKVPGDFSMLQEVEAAVELTLL